MHYVIRDLNFKEVGAFSDMLKKYSCEAILSNDSYQIDAKSILGVLSALHNKAFNLTITELDHNLYEQFNQDLLPFLRINKK